MNSDAYVPASLVLVTPRTYQACRQAALDGDERAQQALMMIYSWLNDRTNIGLGCACLDCTAKFDGEPPMGFMVLLSSALSESDERLGFVTALCDVCVDRDDLTAAVTASLSEAFPGIDFMSKPDRLH